MNTNLNDKVNQSIKKTRLIVSLATCKLSYEHFNRKWQIILNPTVFLSPTHYSTWSSVSERNLDLLYTVEL